MKGFRQFRTEVQHLLLAAGQNPRGLTDGALIESWLAGESAWQLVIRFLDLIAADRPDGGAMIA
jgi:hypothetical protein